MLYLLDRDVRTVRWNGLPLHEASSAIVTEALNGDCVLVVKYPISDSGIYRQIREDMLIKAPVPVLGFQLFRIKKPVEHDDHVELTAYHITDDIMQRSVEPMGVNQMGCAMALSQLVQRVKTPLGDFSLTSDIFDRHTFNTKETETLYSVLMDGKHSIVGTWEGELVRDNFALSVKKARGADRGVIITTHNNLESYQRTRNSQGVVTRVHAKSTFRPEGAEVDTVLQVTVDSPLINQYPYINEKEYENNEAKTVEELRKWAEAKFKYEGIDKVVDAIEIDAVELDGQTVHLGDTVTIKSRKHGVDLTKKAIAYEFDCLANSGKGAYLSLTFDDKPGAGGSGVSSGVSAAAEAILEAAKTAEDRAIDKAIANANAAFDAEFDKAKQAIEDGIEEAKAAAEVVKAEIGAEVEAVARESQAVKQAVYAGLAEADRKAKAFESDVRDRVALVETRADQVADQARQSDQKADQALTKAGASETLAQTAKQATDRAKTDAAAALARAEAVKREAIAEAQRLDTVQRTDAESKLATARTELLGKTEQLQTELETAKRSIASQARDILTQAQAQSELTTRLQTVETTANGTKTTVTELSKTLNTATGNLASVTQRVASTETSLAGVRDQYSQLSQTVSGQTGQITAVTRQTADLQRGLNGVTERFENLRIGGVNLLRNSDFSQGKAHWARLPDVKTEGDIRFVTLPTNLWAMSQSVDVVAGETYTISFYARKRSAMGANPRVSVKFDRHNTDTGQVEVTGTDWQRVVLTHQATQSLKETIFFLNRNNVEVDIRHVQVERGNVVTDWSPADEDIRQELATYVRTATENTSRLERNIQTTDGKAESARTLAQQTAQGLALKAEKSTVDGLAGRVQSAETSIQAIGGRITTEIAETKALIPTEVGGRNLIKKTGEPFTMGYGITNTTWNSETQRTRLTFGAGIELARSGEILPQGNIFEGQRFVIERGKTYTQAIRIATDARFLGAGILKFTWFGPEVVSGANGHRPYPAQIKKIGDKEYLVWSTVTWDRPDIYLRPFDTQNLNTALDFRNTGTFLEFYKPKLEIGSLVSDWSPAPEDMMAELETVKTTLTQTSEGQQQLSRRLSETQDKVTTAETKITQLIGDVGSKVSQVEFDRVKSRVDSQQTAITQNSSAIALKAEKTYVDGVKSTADSAKAIADGLKTTSATKAELKVLSDGITQLATKTEVNGVTGRLTTAEASIRTQAEQIAQRLTSTQVEKAITDKGYQTKAQVDANITGRGYITTAALAGYVPTTTFDNYKTETAQAIERGLTATKALIPTMIGAKNFIQDFGFAKSYLFNSNQSEWRFERVSDPTSKSGWHIKATCIKAGGGGFHRPLFDLRGADWQGKSMTFAVDVKASRAVTMRLGAEAFARSFKTLSATTSWQRFVQVDQVGFRTYHSFVWYIDSGTWQVGDEVYLRDPQLEEGTVATTPRPATEDMVTSVDFNRVKETAQLYERVIGRSEGDIQTNVARQVLTSQLYQTEVANPLSGMSTKVNQLEDSYAIRVLGSSSRILTEINANASGLRLAGKLIHLDGTVTASDAFFRSVLADKIEAGNIKAGAITTAKIAAGAVTADHLLVNQAMIDKLVTNSVWADRLFAQSAFMAKLQATKIQAGQIDAGLIDTAMLAANAVTADKLLVNQAFFNKLMANEAYLRQLFAKQAFITQVQAVELSANRIKSGILQAINGAMSVNLDSGQILYYTDQAALKRILSGYPTQFIKFATGNVDGKGPAGVTVIGSNRDGSESSNNGGFVGIRAWNGPNVDLLDLVGDEIRLASSAYDSSDGWNVTTLPGRLVIEPHRAADRTSARIGLGDIRIFYNSTTYSSLVNILDRIFDNFKNLNNNGNYQRNFYDTWK